MSLVSDEELQAEQTQGTSLVQDASSTGVEVVSGLIGELGARAIGKKVPFGKTAIRAISGGVGSYIAQKSVEGRKEPQVGRLIAAAVANSVPLEKAKIFTARPIAELATKGAGIAAAETAIAQQIDNGEIDPTSLGVSVLVGGALGAGVGKLSKKFIRTSNELVGKEPEEIERMILNGELDDDAIRDMLSVSKNRNVSQAEVQRVKSQIEIEAKARFEVQEDAPFIQRLLQFKNYFVPSRAIGKNVREEYFNFETNFRRAEALSTRLKRNVDNLILNRPELRKDINDFIQGKPMSAELAAHPISGDLRAARDIEIQSMQELYEAIHDSDTINFLPKEQREKILSRMQDSIQRGVHAYDSSMYRAFYDKTFTTNIKEDAVVQEVFDTLMRGQDPTNEKIVSAARKKAVNHVKYLKSLTSGDKTKTQALVAALPGRFEKIIDNHMPGPIERKFLGEVTSSLQIPGERSRFLVRDLIMHKARIDADKTVLQALKESGQISYEKRPGDTELKLPSSSGVDANGRQMYVPYSTGHAIQLLFKERYQDQVASSAAQHMLNINSRLVGYSKGAKVVLNPGSYSVNLIGGIIAALSNGVLPTPTNIKNFTKGFGLAKSELHSLYNLREGKGVRGIRNSEIRQQVIHDVNEMYRYGIGNGSIAANEVADAINNGKVQGPVQQVFDAAGKLYNISDTASRFTIFKHNDNVFQRILKSSGASTDQIKRIAADVTNDTYQNYDRTSKIAKEASRLGIMPQFVTFTLEMFRNTYNQAVIAARMINGDAFAAKYGLEMNDKMRSELLFEGTKRAGFMTAVLGSTFAAPKLMGALGGGPAEGDVIESDKMEDFRFFLPEYARDKDVMGTFNPKTKNGIFANTSYIFPHAVMTQPVSAIIAGASNMIDDEEGVRSFYRLAAEEFIGEGTFVGQNIYNTFANRDMRGETITDREGAQKLKDLIVEFGIQTFEPGISKEGIKLTRAIGGRGDYSVNEILLRQVGLRYQKINVSDMAKYRIQDFSRRYSSARGEYTTALKYKDLSPQGQQAAYERAVSEQKAAYDRVQEAYNRLDSFGYSSDEKIDVLRSGNVKSSDIYRISRGMPFKAFQPGLAKSTGEQYSELFDNKEPSFIRKEISRLRKGSKEDKLQAARFFSEFKRRSSIKRKGRSKEDQLLMNMSIAERAEILADMNVLGDRSLYNEYKRKGIISKDVNTLLNK